MHKFLKLPLTYEQTAFDDDRFMKVRIKVMHNGLNLNNSRFSDTSIEKAAKTLSNIPLLAYIKQTDGVEDADFAGHEFEIRITEDEMKYVYLGRPIGMIPETNNYSYEEDEDGIKFVYVDGYIWKDYANEALDIIARDNGKKVSMEIRVDDYDMTDSAIDINDYKYTGITLLGEDIPEAMTGARADISEFSQETMQEFIANFSSDLGEAMDPSERKEIGRPIPEEDFEIKEVEAGVGEKDEVVEEEEIGRPIEEEEEVVEEPIEEEEAEEEEPVEEEEAIEEEEPAEEETEEEEPVEKEEEIKREEGINSDLDDIKILNNELQADFDALQAKYDALEIELKDLRDFKANIEKTDRDAKLQEIVSEFSDLEESEISDVVASYSALEDIELRLFAIRGKKNSVESKGIVTYTAYDGIISKDSSSGDEPSWHSLIPKNQNK